MKKWLIAIILIGLLMIPVASAQLKQCVEPDPSAPNDCAKWETMDIGYKPENELSNEIYYSVFVGAIVGLITSTYIPYFLKKRRESDTKFEYDYLKNATFSAIATATSYLAGVPTDAHPLFVFVTVLLIVGGVKKIADGSTDKIRKERDYLKVK